MKSLLRALIAPYAPAYPATLVYMLQNTEYQVRPYLAWYWRTQDFSRVVTRRELDHTRVATMLQLAITVGMIAQIILGLCFLALWHWHGFVGGWAFGLALIIAYPVVWAHLAIVSLVLGRVLIIQPRERRAVAASEQIFKDHPGAKIAIAGSYGKTTMKELLRTVFQEGKTVAATPANMNVAISHARFARSLTGKEDILLLEYGEGAPGDVAQFARTTHPTHAVITGVAAAHLDKYKTLAAAGEDIFSVADALPEPGRCYVNGDSRATISFTKPAYRTYTSDGALGWKVHDVTVDITGTTFTLRKGKRHLELASGLIGRHELGPLCLAVALAHEFGMSDEVIIKGVANTKPFEHRMQPHALHGAWLIDDTYNGNIEGIRAGTALLHELPAKRKVYVTPGLVDQGKETPVIHEDMGRLIAASGADLVVLMKNSVTEYIERGLRSAQFAGEIRIETQPLEFYTNVQHFISAGDVILMQNDWPDNYA